MTGAFRPRRDLEPDDPTLVEDESVDAGSVDIVRDADPDAPPADAPPADLSAPEPGRDDGGMR